MCNSPAFSSRIIAATVAIFIGSLTPIGYAQTDNADQWISQLKQGTVDEKCEAADQISDAQLSQDALASALLGGLEDSSPKVQWHTARAVGRLRVKSAAIRDQLAKLLAAKNPVVRIHAARALVTTDQSNDAVVKGLVNMVTDRDGRVARVGIAALRELKPDRELLAENFAEVLAHDEQAVASYAVEALIERGADAVPFLKEALKKERSGYWAAVAIEQIGPSAIETLPELQNLLQNTSDVQVRTQCLLSIAALGPDAKDACGTITGMLDDQQDTAVRAAAAYGLGAIGCSSAKQQLSQAAEDNDTLVSMIATWALAMVQPDDSQAQQRAVKKLIQGLKSDETRVRVVAAKGLHQLNAPPELVAPQLIAAANDPDPSVLANVLDALASLGPTVLDRAVPALKKPEVREIAVAVISRLGSQAGSAVPGLLDAIDPDAPEFNSQVHHAFAEIGAATPEVIQYLTKALKSSNEEIRHSAIYALGRLGPKAAAATDSLKELTDSDNSFDPVAAAWALVQIHPQDQKIAKMVIPHLTKGLENDDAIIRVASANALGQIGAAASEATDKLKSLADDDPNPAVREAAEVALESID